MNKSKVLNWFCRTKERRETKENMKIKKKEKIKILGIVIGG